MLAGPSESAQGGGNNNHVFTSRSQVSLRLRNTIHDNRVVKLLACSHGVLEGNDGDNVDLSNFFCCVRGDVEATKTPETIRVVKKINK